MLLLEAAYNFMGKWTLVASYCVSFQAILYVILAIFNRTLSVEVFHNNPYWDTLLYVNV